MTRILPILLLLALTLRADGAHIAFNLADFVTGSISQRAFTLTPQSTPRTNTTSVITSDSFRYITTTLGTRTVSNMVDGVYKVDVAGPQTITTFYINVPDTNALLNAKDLLTSTNSVPATIYGYTMSQADGRFVKIYNGFSSNQIATNMWFRGASGNATNVFIHTNSTPGRFLSTDGSNAFWKVVTGGGGSIANVGSGIGVYKGNNGGVDEFKTITGFGVDVSSDADNLYITAQEGVGSISLSNVLFVATNGNDSTAVKGRLDLPWRSISNAVAAVANNEAIVIYAGDYIQPMISNQVIYALTSKTNITITGVGQPTIWATNVPYGRLFKLTSCSDITIENLRMIGSTERPGLNGTAVPIELAGAGGNPNCTFQGLDVISWAGHGIVHLDEFRGSDTNFVVTQCYFEMIGATNSPVGYDGVAIAVPGSHANIHHNFIKNCVRGIELEHLGTYPVHGANIAHNIIIGTMGEAILCIPSGQWDQTQGTVIEGNIIWGWHTNQVNGAYWGGILVAAGKGYKINNNYISGHRGGGIIVNVSTAIKQLSMSGNLIKDGECHGIYAAGFGAAVLEDVIIDFNSINNVTNTGISIYGRNVDILGNHIYDASVAHATAQGILVGDTGQATNRTTNIVVAMNTVGNQSGAHIETGIQVDSGAKSTKIFGNTLRVATTPINDLDTTTASHDIVYSKNLVGRVQDLHATNSVMLGTNASGAAQMIIESIPDDFGNGTNDIRIYNNSDNTFGSILLGFPGSRLKVATDTFWQFRDNADTAWIGIGAKTLTIPNLSSAESAPASGHIKIVGTNNLVYAIKSDGTMVNLEEVAAGGGDSILLNGASATDANFTNALDLIPLASIGVDWTGAGASPSRLNANFKYSTDQFATSLTRSNSLAIKPGALVTNLFMYGTNKLDTSANMTNASTTAEGEWVLDWRGDELNLITNAALRIFAAGRTNWFWGLDTPPADGQIAKYIAALKSVVWTNDAGGAGTPGGSSSQIQYNSGGSFGGAVHVAVQGDRLFATNAHVQGVTNPGPFVYVENTISSAIIDAAKNYWYTNITGNASLVLSNLPLDHRTTVYVTNQGQHTVTWNLSAGSWVWQGRVEPKAVTNGVSVYQFWRGTADNDFTNAVMLAEDVTIDFGSGTVATTNSQNRITVTVPGGAGGDSITVNGNAVVDPDFTNDFSILPASAIGIDWLTNPASPHRIVGNFLYQPDHFTFAGTSNKLAIKNGALLTNVTIRQELELPHVTASTVAIFNSGNQLTNSATVNSSEIEFVDGATENLQALAAEKLANIFTNGVFTAAVTNINWRNSDLAVGVEIRATNNPTGTIGLWPVLRDRYETHAVYAGAMTTNLVDPATFTSITASNGSVLNMLLLDYMSFADTGSNTVMFPWVPPLDWNLGTIRAKAFWYATDPDATETNVLGFSGVAVSHNDGLTNCTFGTEIQITNKLNFAYTNQLSVQTAPITIGGTPAASDMVWIKVRRLTANDNDVMEGDLRLLAVWIQYLRNGAEPAAWSP